MALKDITGPEIIDNEKINSQFFSIINNDLKQEWKTYKGNFFLDSFNYFPITTDNYTFKDHFSWGDIYKYENFYTQEFFDNFYVKKNSFKKLSNTFVLGSSISDNYYRNIITFLPRIFFIDDKEINLGLHRNSSNRFRELIQQILKQMNIKINKFNYLDDDFYFFEDSKIPQFFNDTFSVKILNKILSKKNVNKKNKLYLSRQNSNYRNLINEGDIIENLKNLGFEILDTNNISILEQINKFSEAETIISATSSSLANIVFCSEQTNIIEIIPKYQFEYENELKFRYSGICEKLGLNYMSIEADPIEINNIPSNVSKYISNKVLNESNYYKDLLIEKNKFETKVKTINMKN